MSKLILDACCNHLGSTDIIDEMIKVASKYADYIKFQLYNTEKLNKNYPNYYNVNRNMSNMEIKELGLIYIFDKCKQHNIIPMFTIMHESKIETLFNVVNNQNLEFALKVASPDITNDDLILKLIRTFKDKLILISTGMHTKDEIDHCVDRYTSIDVRFLHCISMYPTPPDMIDINMINELDGFSDHTVGLTALRNIVSKVDMGYYERHFTLSKNLPITDKDWSVEPEDLKEIRNLLDIRKTSNKYKTRWGGNDV